MALNDKQIEDDFEELIKEIKKNEKAIKNHERKVKRLNKNPFTLFD